MISGLSPASETSKAVSLLHEAVKNETNRRRSSLFMIEGRWVTAIAAAHNAFSLRRAFVRTIRNQVCIIG